MRLDISNWGKLVADDVIEVAESDGRQDEQSNTELDLVIYRNDEFITGLVQQIYKQGLLTEGSQLSVAAVDSNSSSTAGVDAGGKIGGSIPFFGNASAHTNVNGQTGSASGSKDELSTTDTFTYTAHYHFQAVKAYLQHSRVVQKLTDRGSTKELEPGDFVEFTAGFRPNEFNTLLDLVTPDLAAAFVHYQSKQKVLESWDSYQSSGHDQLQNFIQKERYKAEGDAQMASAVVSALRQDFKNEITREFFGSVVTGSRRQGATAVVICDTEHFIGKDQDRILDGQFKVLGKVVSVTAVSDSILARNKFLNRIQQPWLDELGEKFDEAGADGKFDASFTLELKGPVVRVIPVAIYA